MFCKWCGGTLSPSDVNCSRCGRSVPPLSVCGGFSELKPAAEKDMSPKKIHTTDKNIQPQKAEQRPKSSSKKSSKGHTGLLLLGFGLICVLILFLFVRIHRQSAELEELKGELHIIANQISDLDIDEDSTESTAQESTPETEDRTPVETAASESAEPVMTTSSIEASEEPITSASETSEEPITSAPETSEDAPTESSPEASGSGETENGT